MLSSFLETLLKVSKTTCPQKLFAYDCVTLYILYAVFYISVILKDIDMKPFPLTLLSNFEHFEYKKIGS